MQTDEEKKAKNREKLRKWRAANPDKAREKSRKWRAANPDKARETARKWRAANRDKVREIDRKWRANNPEKVKAKNQKSTHKQRELRHGEDREKMLIKHREYQRVWKAANPERLRVIKQKSKRKWITENPDGKRRQYLKRVFAEVENVETRDMLLETKLLQLHIKRIIREGTNEKHS